MGKTKLTFSAFLPTTSISRVQDYMTDLVKVANSHKASDFFAVIEGPFSDNAERVTNYDQSESSRTTAPGLGRGPGNGTEPGIEPGIASDGTGEPGTGRKRGRPPGSTKKEGQAPVERDGERERPEGPGSARQDGNGNVIQRTRESPQQGRSERTEGDGGSGRSGGPVSRSEPPSRISTGEDRGEDDGWGNDDNNPWDEPSGDLTVEEAVNLPGDEWPDYLTPKEIDRTVMNTLLGDHYRATGGKDRGLTLEVMDRVTGVQQIAKVDERDYVKLARALIKDAARYEQGIKKPK